MKKSKLTHATLLSDPSKTPRIMDEQGSPQNFDYVMMPTEGKETGATTTDDSNLEILPGVWTLGY